MWSNVIGKNLIKLDGSPTRLYIVINIQIECFLKRLAKLSFFLWGFFDQNVGE